MYTLPPRHLITVKTIVYYSVLNLDLFGPSGSAPAAAFHTSLCTCHAPGKRTASRAAGPVSHRMALGGFSMFLHTHLKRPDLFLKFTQRPTPDISDCWVFFGIVTFN